MTDVQDPPFAVQIEPTEGCNLRCGFCGIQGVRPVGPVGDRSGPYRYMRVSTIERVAQEIDRLGWSVRWEIAMHGEPTLNPRLAEIVAIVRAYQPRASIMLTTNGIPLLDDFDARVDALYDAGLNTIALDDYRPHRVAPTARRYRRPGVLVTEYPDDPAGNPHRRRSLSEPRLLSIMRDISEATEGSHAWLNNHCGAGAPRDPDHHVSRQRCAIPFREIAVRHDGAVAICCNDWRGEFRVGNVNDEPLDAIWNAPPLAAARRRLYRGLRDFGPCDGCTERTSRLGLLPDKLGRVDLPAPAEGDAALIAAACTGDPLTEPLPRAWETVTWRGRLPED